MEDTKEEVNVKYSKPYIKNSNRPNDAENIFKKRLSIIDNNDIIGFIDESSLQLYPNKLRMINTKEIRYDYYKKNITIFGFMAINGNDIAMVSSKARKEDMITFLELIGTNLIEAYL